MALEGGLVESNKTLGSIFERQLQDWGHQLPRDLLIGDFLRDNKEICKLKEIDSYWIDKKMDQFCLSVVHAKNKDANGNNGNDNNGNKDTWYIKNIDPEKKRELYEALDNYTDDRIDKFKKKEANKEKLKISEEQLLGERSEILRFVRAREALNGNNGKKNFVQEVNEQKIRYAKGVLRDSTLMKEKAG